MKKRGLLVVVAMLALSCMMAAMAFNAAAITSTGNLTVKNTSESLVSLLNNSAYTGGLGNKDNTVQMVDNQLVFKFGWAGNSTVGENKLFGMQKNSEYIWNKPFAIHNVSAEKVKITLTATGDMANYVSFGSTAAGLFGYDVWHSTTYTYTSDPLNNNNIKGPGIKISIPQNDVHNQGTTLSGTIIVTAEAIN